VANELSAYELAVIRIALNYRYDALARAADPQNPWQDQSAVQERAVIANLRKRLSAASEELLEVIDGSA